MAYFYWLHVFSYDLQFFFFFFFVSSSVPVKLVTKDKTVKKKKEKRKINLGGGKIRDYTEKKTQSLKTT
jgi:hypothetical protein